MSVVTSVLLNLHPEDVRERLPELQARLCEERGHPYAGLGDLADTDESVAQWGRRWGGAVRPEATLFGAAYNVIDLQHLLGLVLSVEWLHPDAVQLFVEEQEDLRLTIYEIVDGGWQALRPARRPRAARPRRFPHFE